MPAQPPILFTKIIATVGPACQSPEILARLIEEGVDLFRINFSHGTSQQHTALRDAIVQAAGKTGMPVGILGDLGGPKIRVGQVTDPGVELAMGQHVRFTAQPVVADQHAIFALSLPGVIADVQPGHRLFIDDGNVRLLVTDKSDDTLTCTVTTPGTVTSSKGVNLPDTQLNLPSFTERDRQCVQWALAAGIDYLALSFVRKADDIRELKALLRSSGAAAPPIIAKIEKPQALDDLEAIAHESDALMVARGDLGVEMDLAEVPAIQKQIIELAHDFGKPVIVATQMLQSMIAASSPTRAEVSDVANAIYDGADAVMLSGETAVGRYPIPAVMMMARVAAATQRHLQSQPERFGRPPRRLQDSKYRTAALAHGVAVIVKDLDAALVVTWSETGNGARYLSQNRLGVPIIAASSCAAALRRMNLFFGVVPVSMELPSGPDQFLAQMDRLILARRWAQQGDAVVVIDGYPLGTAGLTNHVRIHYLGDVCRL